MYASQGGRRPSSVFFSAPGQAPCTRTSHAGQAILDILLMRGRWTGSGASSFRRQSTGHLPSTTPPAGHLPSTTPPAPFTSLFDFILLRKRRTTTTSASSLGGVGSTGSGARKFHSFASPLVRQVGSGASMTHRQAEGDNDAERVPSVTEVDGDTSLGGPASWVAAPIPLPPLKSSLKPPPRVQGPLGYVTKAGPPRVLQDLKRPGVQEDLKRPGVQEEAGLLGSLVTVRERRSIGGLSSVGERKSAHFDEHHPEGVDECMMDDDEEGDAGEVFPGCGSGSTNLDLTLTPPVCVPSMEGYSQPLSLCAGQGRHVSARGSMHGPLGVMEALGGRATMLELLQDTWTLAPASTQGAVVVHRYWRVT